MDIAIIGAGPIGSYIGWKLSQKGEDVTIFERKRTPYKPCSGLFSKRILEFINLPQRVVENEIDTIEIRFPKRKIILKLKQPLLVVNRKLFNNFMFSLAKGTCKIIFKNVKKINEEGEVYLSSEKKRKFDIIVGADGALSVVRKSLGISDPEMFLGIQFFRKEKNTSNTAITWATEHGFFWKIPRGKRVEYGVLEKPQTAKRVFLEFCKKLKIKPYKTESALVPIGLKISNNEKVFLCGDSAGMCKPWSGGGIVWSLTAAEIFISNFPNIEKSNKEIEKKFKKRQEIYKFLNKFVRRVYGFLPSKIQIDTDWLI